MAFNIPTLDWDLTRKKQLTRITIYKPSKLSDEDLKELWGITQDKLPKEFIVHPMSDYIDRKRSEIERVSAYCLMFKSISPKFVPVSRVEKIASFDVTNTSFSKLSKAIAEIINSNTKSGFTGNLFDTPIFSSNLVQSLSDVFETEALMDCYTVKELHEFTAYCIVEVTNYDAEEETK